MAAAPGGAGGGGGAGVGPPAEPVKPPTEAPEALRPYLDLLTKPLALILVAKQIPWVVQAKLAQQGYVTVEDLGDRWNTPEDARAQGPRDLEFQDGENNFLPVHCHAFASGGPGGQVDGSDTASCGSHRGRGTPRHGQGPPGQPLRPAGLGDRLC